MLSCLEVDGVVTKNSVLMSRQRQAAAQPETSYVCITPLRMLLKKRSDPRFGNNGFFWGGNSLHVRTRSTEGQTVQ